MLTFGDVTIEPGEKKQFTLPVTQSPSGQSLGFPMVVVNGKHEGPKFLVDGGIHGDEYESAEAIRGTWRDLDPAALHGAFAGVPSLQLRGDTQQHQTHHCRQGGRIDEVVQASDRDRHPSSART